MGIDVTRLQTDEREQWNRQIERTSEAMPFHRLEALESLAAASDTELHLLVGRKGQEWVGLLPLFEGTKGPLRFVSSPPTELEVPYLGPLLLNTDQIKQRKAEKWNRQFIENCIEWLDATLDADHVDIRTLDRYLDARPFIWNGLDVEPAYTYVLDLTPGADALIEQFSSVVRKNIRGTDESAYDIEVGDERTIRRIVSQLQDRFGGEEGDFGLEQELAVDLYESLPDGRVRPYVCRVDGEYASGILTIEHGDTVYNWQGGAKPEVDLPVNDLLHWHIIRRALDRDKTRYDLVGAMMPRLAGYKAKFGPEPRPLFMARRKSNRMKLVSSVYNRVPDEVKSAIGV